jgi:hypothetical protein
MNKRILLLTTLVSAVIVVICVMAASLYNSARTVPAIQTQEGLRAEFYAEETASSVAATVSSKQTQDAIPTNTPLPSPTVTPTIAPEAITCAAIIQGTTRAIYPVPGQGFSYFSQPLASGTEVTILGRLTDRGWQKIEADGVQGWIRDDGLSTSGSCQPTIFDLHYLQNWVGPTEQLLLEDTFAFGDPWMDSNGSTLLTKASSTGEAMLEVLATNEVLLSPPKLTKTDISAFKIFSSITVDQVREDSFIGVRFRENGSNYYQVELFPKKCLLVVYDSENLVYSNELDPAICIDRYYDISAALAENNRFELQINGFDPISMNLQDSGGQQTHGSVKMAANNIGMQLNYFVLVAPK